MGAFPSISVRDEHVTLGLGDSLVLYTDGVTEGRRGDEFYGDDRLHALLTAPSGNAAELSRAIVDDVVAFQSERPRDDIAVLVIQVPPASAGSAER